MGKVVRAIAGAALIVVGVVTGNFQLIVAGANLVAGALLQPSGNRNRAASAAQLQLGEQPRQAIVGRAAVGGSLVDAFNYGGKYGTDWEVLVIALADHRCDALEGFFVDDRYVAFAGDGTVAGFNSQLQVFWRSGTWDQTVPSILTTNGPGWTANDRGRGVAYVVVAYKADKSDAKNPVWPSGRPRFRWVVRGLRCYDPRLDSTVGGSGAHRRDNPATWAWSENPIVIRHNWVRGIYAGDRVTEPGMLLVGRGLSAIEAPPANVFPRANLCDEVVGGTPRYRIGGVIASTEPFIDIESDFAAAVGGVISQPEGAVEVDPGQAKAAVAHFTDADILVTSTVKWNERILGQQDDGWINTVAARFVDPGQRWNIRSAPVRRELADVIADGGPREIQPQLDLVTNAPQAQRVAEIIRRLGRLWGRAEVTLPPRFAFIEEGDWVTWQSDRRFGGATLTFRVEAWGSDRAWHHRLVLRQISASVYSDTAPLDDGVIANDQPPPPVVAAPDLGAWNVAAVLLGSGSVRVPNLRVAGTPDDPAADFVVFEYVPQAAAPDAATIWTFAGSARPDVRLLDIPVIGGGTYWVGVSYVVDGIQGDRRVLGPISTAGLAYGDGSPVAPVAPANANRVPLSRMEGDSGWLLNFDAAGIVSSTDHGTFQGMRFFRARANATAANQVVSLSSSPFNLANFRLTPGERISIQCRVEAAQAAAGTWSLTLWGYRADGSQYAVSAEPGSVASGAAPRFIGNDPVRFFLTVPSDVIGGRLELYGISGGAGLMDVVISEPMVTSAAAGQTVHPPFSPGPVVSEPINAGGPLLVGTLPPSKAAPGLINANLPLGNANRLPFTRLEGGRGWVSVGDIAAPAPFLIQFDGRFYIANEPTFTAANQNQYLVSAPRIQVRPGERLSVSAAVQAFTLPSGGPPSFWQLYIEYNDSPTGGTGQGADTIASGNSGMNESVRHAAFSTVPSGARFAQLVLRFQSAGAGLARLAILEPMITSAAADQVAHPPYSPGPNARDGADPNSDITVDGAGIISGIGTANIFVDNRRTIPSGPIAARPASGAFIGQSYAATDTGEITQWDGFNWRSAADITFAISGPADVALNYDSALNLTSPLPVTATYQLAAAGSGSITSGVTWGVNVASGNFAGAAPSIVGTGAGQLRINSAMTSPTAELRITASFGGRTYPLFTVKISRNVAAPSNAGGGAAVSAPLTTISTSVFTRMHASDLTITLPAGVTSASLVASGSLAVDPTVPVGGSTVEGKWQRESSPGVWSDVGAVATSSPDAFVSDAGLVDAFGQPVYTADAGSISCNRTASGLVAGSTQKFRFVARVSSGNVRVVTGSGNVSATA